MWAFLKRDEVKASAFLLIYLISMSTPYAFREVAVIRILFIICRLLCTVMVVFSCFKRKVKWNSFDVLTLFFCITIFISAFHAGFSGKIITDSNVAYLYTAFSRIVFIIGQLVIIKLVFDTREQICLVMMKTIYGFYIALCLINLMTQVLGWEVAAKSGNTFFLGLDNEAGKYYLFAIFYCCVVMVLEKKKFSRELFLLTALTMTEGVYRQIGGLTAISFLLVGLVFMFYFAPQLKIWKIRHDIVLGIMIGAYILVMLLFTRLDVLQGFINNYLFGKASSLTVRFALQTRFISMWLKSPLWGWASTLSRTQWGDTTWFDYALRGGQIGRASCRERVW